MTGANGMGKTTLIRTLAGLAAPFAGTIERAGDIGLVDDRCALEPDLPLGKALSFWERIDRSTLEGRAQAIASLGLEGLMDVPVRYLSTGQKKRTSLAVLLAREVPIWLLDEPLSGLDTQAIATVTALIEAHLNEGGLALIASHQPLGLRKLATLALGDFAPEASADIEHHAPQEALAVL